MRVAANNTINCGNCSGNCTGCSKVFNGRFYHMRQARLNGIVDDIVNILQPRNPDGTIQPLATVATEVIVPTTEYIKMGAFFLALRFTEKLIFKK